MPLSVLPVIDGVMLSQIDFIQARHALPVLGSSVGIIVNSTFRVASITKYSDVWVEVDFEQGSKLVVRNGTAMLTGLPRAGGADVEVCATAVLPSQSAAPSRLFVWLHIAVFSACLHRC